MQSEGKSDEIERNAAERNLCSALRTVSANNQSIASQADRKAHILIQANGLMVSVLLLFSIQAATSHLWMFLPAAIQLAGSLADLVLSLQVTKPRWSANRMPTVSFDLDDEVPGLLSLNDPGVLYGNLLRVIHTQAVIIAAKFRWLLLAYYVFIASLILSLLSTVFIAFFKH